MSNKRPKSITPLEDSVRRRFIKIRMKKGLSQGKIAKILGVTAMNISQYETGGISTLKKLEEVFNALGYGVKITFTPNKEDK